jgi:hypothetical protein
METAKVDIRRLQMLNDCINRTIEALNQVRLSVHAGGLSHTAPIGLAGAIGNPFLAGYPGALNAFGTNPGIAPQYAAQYAAQFAPQVFGWAQPGLGHTGVFGWPQPNLAQTGVFGWTQPGLGHTGVNFPGVNYQGVNTVGQDFINDPYVTARIAQTFPFVNWGYSPFAWPTV